MKPAPRHVSVDTRADFRGKCRIFNRSVENVVCRYDDIFISNVDEIRPDSASVFDHSGSKLNNRGIKKLWIGINEVVEHIDSGRVKPFKYVYQDQLRARAWENQKNQQDFNKHFNARR